MNLSTLYDSLLFRFITLSDAPIEEEDILTKLFPKPWDALAIFLSFLVLLVIVIYFAYKPVKKLLKERGDYVEGKIKDAEVSQETANKHAFEAENILLESKKKAVNIVEVAKQDALNEKSKIVKQTKVELEQEKEKALMEIEMEIKANKEEIHKNIVSVALDASQKVLEREVSKEDNERLLNDFVDDLMKEE